MNRITFDKIVGGNPDMYSFVTLPEPVVEVVPETGKWQPSIPSDKGFNIFA